MVRLLGVAALATGLIFVSIPARAVDWPVFGFDPARTSFNSSETMLTTGNVHGLRMQWQTSLGSAADSAPIYLESVRVKRAHIPMLFITTGSGVTLGIEATTGKLIWKYATHGPNYTHSMPAADPSGTAIYAPGLDGKVHKLHAATGREMSAPGFPALITRIPNTEANESSLNVANGYLYATISGYNGDGTPYDGHVVAVNLSTGKKTVFNSLCSNKTGLLNGGSCSQQRSGIWARGGAVIDPSSSMNGRVYAVTGNGQFDANMKGGVNYGDSVLSLRGDLSQLYGSYTPSDYQQLQNGDVDLGSTSPAMLPEQPSSQTPWMLVQGGKDAVLKLVNRAALPGVGNEIYTLPITAGLFSNPAVWSAGSNAPWIFLGFSSEVDAFQVQTSASGSSMLVQVWRATPGSTYGEGTSPVVANGIVFVAFDGSLVALNATNGHLLWNSAKYGSSKSIGSVHWESPIVVNGWLYCSDENGNLTAFAIPKQPAFRFRR